MHYNVPVWKRSKPGLTNRWLINYVLIVNEIIFIIFVNSGTFHSFWSLALIKKKYDERWHFWQYFDATIEKFLTNYKGPPSKKCKTDEEVCQRKQEYDRSIRIREFQPHVWMARISRNKWCWQNVLQNL